MKIIYEPHPVSSERKKELRSQGFKIVDARFKPADTESQPVKQPKRQIKPKAAE